MRDYHRLEIWRRAHALAIAIHEVARGLRGNELAGLRSQLTRAADSVAANIVEGCGAASVREFTRALIPRRWRQLSSEAVEIRRMTYAYRKRLLEDDT